MSQMQFMNEGGQLAVTIYLGVAVVKWVFIGVLFRFGWRLAG